MGLHPDIGLVLQHYGLAGEPRGVAELEATHRAFRIDIDGRSYALRQFNPFMTSGDFAAQASLAASLADAGLATPPPLPTNGGERFVRLGDHLWALFPWCDGRPGDSRQSTDLFALVEAQGNWARIAGEIAKSPHWDAILSTARRFRRRKDWAWIVPLDQVPRFVDEEALPRLRACSSTGRLADELRCVLSRLSDAALQLAKMLAGNSVSRLPHIVSHGDFWASNICISRQGTYVLDLDCFSYEPRVADFARAAHWFYPQHSPEENRFLLDRFLSVSRIGPEELKPLPVLICSHSLYYSVGAALRFPGESAAEQSKILEEIRVELEEKAGWDGQCQAVQEAFLLGSVN